MYNTIEKKEFHTLEIGRKSCDESYVVAIIYRALH